MLKLLLPGMYLLAGGWLLNGCISKAGETKSDVKAKLSPELAMKAKVQQHVTAARSFITGHHYNTQFCFLVDMSLPSGRNLFFVYDLEKDTIELAGLVAHGRCNQLWLSGRRYSNKKNSGCTSLGRYKIGKPYSGRFGLAYKLYGVDSTNSNAYERYVVLHSHECVPAYEAGDTEICQSDGCPTVAPAFLDRLAARLDHSQKPVLLWIYE